MCWLWTIIKKAAADEKKQEEAASLEDISMIKKSVRLLGQTNNKAAYFQRLNILNIILNSKYHAKAIINAYALLLSITRTERFRRPFRKQVLDNSKTQKEMFEISEGVNKSKKKPFSTGFPARHKTITMGKCWKPQQKIPNASFFERNDNKNSWKIHQIKLPTIQTVRFATQVATPFCKIPGKLFSLEELEHIHPLVKELFLKEIMQNIPLRGRLFFLFSTSLKLIKN